MNSRIVWKEQQSDEFENHVMYGHESQNQNQNGLETKTKSWELQH